MSSMSQLSLENGEVVNLTLNFAALYKLRSIKKDLYDKYNKIIMTGAADLFDTVTVLYTAYLCANINDVDACMEYEAFLEKLPYTPRELVSKANELVSPKKKKVSGQPS